MNPSDENKREIENDCYYQFFLNEDIGDVCRVCGVIGRAINTIIDFQYIKARRNRAYWSGVEEKNNREVFKSLVLGFNKSANDFSETEIFPHPRLRKLMKLHQVEVY
ncbi:hypothetical protein RJ641_010779 [Dillenia turbinata]|uniref:Uncharacterized protein n=1 Tax=Dillenia turbinata TaxID=194707 RepID=A0AAN8V122_9MAGN